MQAEVKTLRGTYRESRIHAVGLVLACSVFVTLIVGVGIWTPDAQESELEKRRLQTLPTVPTTFLSIPRFVNQVERYSVDQAGFRNQMIQWQRRLKFHLFGILDAERCFLGKDQWLFWNRTDTRYSHQDVISGNWDAKKETTLWISYLKELADWLDSRSVPLVLAFVPNKYSIYPDKLPDWLPYDPEAIPYRQITNALEGYPNVHIVELMDPLIEAKEWSQLYSPSDLHWNGRGAYIGFTTMANAIHDLFPEMRVPTLDEFVLTSEVLDDPTFEKPTDGLSRMTGMPDVFPNTWLGVKPKRPHAAEVDTTHLPQSDANIPVRMPIAFESDSASGPSILYIGDSFRWPVVPFFAESVPRSLFVDARNALFDRQLIESEKPDLVIFSTHGWFMRNDVFEKLSAELK